MSEMSGADVSGVLGGMSALPPKADIGTHPRNVRFVPRADIMQRNKKGAHLVGGNLYRLTHSG